ncbi:transposase, partial [Accumulibacter sp.]
MHRAGTDVDRAAPKIQVFQAQQPLGGPEAVLESLGRYTHGVAISNER